MRSTTLTTDPSSARWDPLVETDGEKCLAQQSDVDLLDHIRSIIRLVSKHARHVRWRHRVTLPLNVCIYVLHVC